MVVLFWPTTQTYIPELCPIKGEKEEAGDAAKSGFVIGWDSNCFFAPSQNNNSAVAAASNGIICAGIVLLAGDPNNGFDDYLHSFQKIQDAIQSLKENTHNIKVNDVPKKSISCDRLNHELHCCTNNIILEELKVVAKWTDGGSTESNLSSCNDGTEQGQSQDRQNSDKKRKTSTKERAEYTSKEHKQQLAPLLNLPLITTKSLRFGSIRLPTVIEQNMDTDATPLQTVLFKPCPLQSLDYYHHSFDTSYYSLFVDDDICIGSKTFSTLLMRLSETESVMDKLNHCLSNQSFETTTNTEAHLNSPVYTHTTLEEITDGFDSKKDSNQPNKKEKRFFNEMLVSNIISCSLTAIQLEKNRKKCCGRRRQKMGQFLITQSPILYLIFYYRSETRHHQNNIYIPRRFLSRKRLTQDRIKFDSVTDGVLGLICGLAIINKHVCVSSILESLWNGIHGRLLRDNIGWLETFPVGFKLNVPLTKVMGRATLWLTETHENFLRSVLMVADDFERLFIKILGLICIVFGFKSTCAVIFDLGRVITLHINIMARVFQNIYQMQLSLFSSLWHLFRGRKKNVLRKRSDTLEFDFMQLLLGMILFTICLFLFTTIFVYYAFFTCIQLTVALYIVCIWILYVILDKLPLGDILAAALSPGRFRREVYFVNITSNQPDSITLTKRQSVEKDNSGEESQSMYEMVASNLSPASIIVQVLWRCLIQFLKKIPSFINEMLSGESSSVIATCLKVSVSEMCN